MTNGLCAVWAMATNEPEWVPAFVLRTRPYQETSLIVDFLIATSGKLSVVAKGVRSKRSNQKGLLQPFLPLRISYSGKSQLKTLRQIEPDSVQINFREERLFSAMYLNELLYHLVEPDTDYPGLFSSYFQTLLLLADTQYPEAIPLRQFELLLLQQLGYGADFDLAADTQELIQNEGFYRLLPEVGFITLTNWEKDCYTGTEIRGIANQSFEEPHILMAARRFCRNALASILGDRPLKSRELYAAYLARRSL